MNIRSFFYLDEYKLYSFSSQLFAGLTEYVITASGETRERQDQSKLAAPAKVVAEIAREHVNREERKFLHDHAYNLFEEELHRRKSVVEIAQGSDLPNLETPKFVRISGQATFFDAILLKKTIDQFNTIGEALAYVTSANAIQEARKAAAAVGAALDRNKKAAFRSRTEAELRPAQIAKSKGMYQEPEFLKSISFLIEYGYQGHLQLQIPLELSSGANLFSAILRRDALREDESITIQKFSRRTDRQLTLVGLVAQAGSISGRLPQDDPDAQPPEHMHMKEAVMQLVNHLANVESTFTGKLANEVIIDPLAVYMDVPISGQPDDP